MTIALCAGGEDREVIRGTLLDWAERGDHSLSLEVYGCREALLRGMKNMRFDAVFLAMPGVEGMEAAIGVRGQNPGVPLVWASDDKLLAILSYRLRVRLFLLSPVEPEQVLEGLERCGLEGPEARYPPPRKASCGRENAKGAGTAAIEPPSRPRRTSQRRGAAMPHTTFEEE